MNSTQHQKPKKYIKTRKQWALIVNGANAESMIVASSYGIDTEVADLSGWPDHLDLPVEMNDGPGFYLWRGLQDFGLDGVRYSEGKTEKIDPQSAMEWMSRHESSV